MNQNFTHNLPEHGQEVYVQYGESLIRAVYNAHVDRFILKDASILNIDQVGGWQKLHTSAMPEVHSL